MAAGGSARSDIGLSEKTMICAVSEVLKFRKDARFVADNC